MAEILYFIEIEMERDSNQYEQKYKKRKSNVGNIKNRNGEDLKGQQKERQKPFKDVVRRGLKSRNSSSRTRRETEWPEQRRAVLGIFGVQQCRWQCLEGCWSDLERWT